MIDFHNHALSGLCITLFVLTPITSLLLNPTVYYYTKPLSAHPIDRIYNVLSVIDFLRCTLLPTYYLLHGTLSDKHQINSMTLAPVCKDETTWNCYNDASISEILSTLVGTLLNGAGVIVTGVMVVARVVQIVRPGLLMKRVKLIDWVLGLLILSHAVLTLVATCGPNSDRIIYPKRPNPSLLRPSNLQYSPARGNYQGHPNQPVLPTLPHMPRLGLECGGGGSEK
eukprot:sb/3469627/